MQSVSPTKGRAPVTVCAFTTFINNRPGGAPALKPYKNELVYDDRVGGSGAIGRIVKKVGGGFTFKSIADEVLDKFNNIDFSGVLESGRMAGLSRDLTYFFFNNSSRFIKINPNLVYPSEYRYYAIKKDNEYVTGIVDGTTVLTNFVDMEVVPATVGEGFVSKPLLGALLPNVTMSDADVYSIEFFDAAKRQVDRDSYHAEAMHIMIDSPTSETAIRSLKFQSTRPIPDVDNACYLFKGENIDQLDYRILVEFADGRFRDVTNDTSGRMTIIGLTNQDIDTSTVTVDGATPQKFTVIYDPTDSGGVNTVSMDIDMYIYPDSRIGTSLDVMVPVYWFNITKPSVIETAHFGLFEDGSFVNLDNNVTDVGDISVSNVSTEQPVRVDMLLGENGSTPVDRSFKIKLYNSDSVKKVSTSDTGSAFLDRYLDLEVDNTNQSNPKARILNVTSVAGLKSNNARTFGGTNVEPTNIRIRNIKGDHYYSTAVGAIIENYNDISIELGSVPLHVSTPVLIEFIAIAADDSIRVTNVRPAYISYH